MIKTNPKMNETVKDLLKMQGESYELYALQRIKELEAENKDLKTRLDVSKSYNKYL